MKSELAISRMSEYLQGRFGSFKLRRRLSDFAYTFLITGDGKDYIIKLIEHKNVVSKIEHTRKHIEAMVMASKMINRSRTIKTISVVDLVIEDRYAILLIKKEKLSKISIMGQSLFQRLGKSIAGFHLACRSIGFKRLAWNNFPTHFIVALKSQNRWQEVRHFLNKSKKLIDRSHLKIVACHNDIHAGNVYYSEGKIIFLDVDDMCSESCFNDLGMVIANFIDSSYSRDKVISVISFLLGGYGMSNSNKNILNTLIFALRKSYFTEAYFLYANATQQKPPAFIYELRKRQSLLQGLIQDYL